MVVGGIHVKDVDRVLKFMRKNAYHEFNAKTLSRILKMDEEKIRTYLNRLHNKGTIHRTTKGFFKANADMTVIRDHQLTNPPTLLHGIMMECEICRVITKWGPPTPPMHKKVTSVNRKKIKNKNSLDDRLIDWLKLNDFGYVEDNYSWFRYVWVEGRRVTITVHHNGKLCVYIDASNNPLSLPEFEAILLYLDGYLDFIAPFKDRKVVHLREIGLAKDFKELNLSGLKAVSLRAFRNAWTRIYYHDDRGLRFEHHLVLDITVDDALKSLSILTTPVNYKDRLTNGDERTEDAYG